MQREVSKDSVHHEVKTTMIFKTTRYAKCDLRLCSVDTNNNPTFNLPSLSQIFGAHVNRLLKTPFKREGGKKIYS